MIYVVIDTNVFVSASLTPQSQSATVKTINHMMANDITVLYNQEILDEYIEVLSREKFHIPQKKIRHIIDFIKEFGISSDRKDFADIMPDEDDRVFYEVTLSREDSFLVTGNLKHFPREPRVITPAQLIEML